MGKCGAGAVYITKYYMFNIAMHSVIDTVQYATNYVIFHDNDCIVLTNV